MRTFTALGVASSLFLAAHAAGAEPPAMWGGFGHASLTGQFGTFGALASNFRRPDALGTDFTLNDLGATFGGGGKALLAGTVLLGGKGYAWLVPSSPPDAFDVTVAGGGGGFDLGFAAFNRDHFLLYPYVGVLGIGLDVEVKNNAARDAVIGGDVLAPGQERRYQSGFLAAEFGIGFQRFLFWRTGGFMLGAEAGFLTTIVRGEWQIAESEAKVPGLERLGFSGGFVRLTLGGGGFSFQDDCDDEQEWEQEDPDR